MFRQRILALSFISVATFNSLVFAAQKYAEFRSVGVELPQLEGFTVSNKWQGLEHPASGGAVLLVTLPAPFAETTAGFTSDRLKAEGMTLEEKVDTTIAGKSGVLIRVTQVQDGVELGKWIAAFGDQATTMIVASFPKEADAELSAVIKSIVVGARAINVQRAPLGANVDFELGPSRTLRLASDENNSLIYTADGTLPQPSPEAPLLVATKGMKALSQQVDLKKFALQRIMQTAAIEVSEVERNEQFTTGAGHKACETIARGKDSSSGVPMLVYQYIVSDTDCYFIVQGLVGANRRGAVAEFQQMAQKLRRVRPGERRTLASDNRTPRERAVRPARRIPDQPAAASWRIAVDVPRSTEAVESPQPWQPHDIPDDRPKDPNPSQVAEEATSETPQRAGGQRAASRTRRARPPRVPRPKQALPEYKYEAEKVQTSPVIGSGDGEPIEVLAPNGGILVGMRVVEGTDFGGSVQAVAPIFQVAGRYKESELQGRQGDNTHLLLAPPGFAIGGVQVGAGAWMDAIRLVYMRVDGNKLVANDRQYSDWIGGDGGGTNEILSDGGLAIGVVGSFKENLQSLGLMYVASDDIAAVPLATKKPIAEPAAETRVWKSASGKHSLNAKLESVEGGQAKLLTADGKRISVSVEKLSPADQLYLRRKKAEASAD